MSIDGNCPVGGTYYNMQFQQQTNYCSDKNAELNAPFSFQYMVCPNELACGDNGNKFMAPEADGTVLTRAIDKYDQTFIMGDVCSWIIRNPIGMNAKDWMWLEISLVEMAEVYVSYGRDYVFEQRSSSRATFGKKYAILKGKEFYVSSFATEVLKGFFKLKTWIEVWEDDGFKSRK